MDNRGKHRRLNKEDKRSELVSVRFTPKEYGKIKRLSGSKAIREFIRQIVIDEVVMFEEKV